MVNGEQQKQVLTDAALRKMNHREWLTQCAMMLETQWTQAAPQMTPFRAGLVGRLRLASAYIDLLEREARDHVREIEALKHDAERESRD